MPRRHGLLKATVSQVHVWIGACALEWAPHGANHTAVGRKFLPTEECIAGAHDPMSWDASPQEAEALSENRIARKTKQGAVFPPQEAGNAAPGPSTPPFRGVLRGRGNRSKSLALLAQDAEYSTTPF